MRVRNLDVAREAGVSPTTVSLVLNNRTQVALAPSTRQRVAEVAARMGYRPNHLARSLLTGRTQTLGVIIPSLASSFVARIVEGIQLEAGTRDQRILLSDTRHNPQTEGAQLELLLQHAVDGVLLVTGESTLHCLPERVRRLRSAEIPCVVIDDRSRAAQADCVVSNDRAGAELAVQHLIELGHRRIGHIAAGAATSTARDRLAGYRQALRRAGLPGRPEWVAGNSFNPDGAKDALENLMSLPEPPTAVFAANDRLWAEATVAVQPAVRRRLQKLAVVGYANYDFAAYLGISSVDQSPCELGKAALRRLLDRIATPSLPPSCIELPVQLVIRGSSRTLNLSLK